ncbi:hypothetical protein ACTWQL_17230 [Pseudalkalibacillus sp. R45]|uniref:hypothetical protein n=1 Tax=Pseudalkalibacillus sp. R45 TaxID=3457433 RepID=UPI003FCDAB87
MKIIGITFLLLVAIITLISILDYHLGTYFEFTDQLNPFTVPDEFEFLLLFILCLSLIVQFYFIVRR